MPDTTSNAIRHLGDGLILRRATVEDAGALIAIHTDLHRDPGVVEPEERVGVWVRDLMLRPHPTFSPGDFTIVEDTATGRIVSSLCLISQTWSYGGVEFGVGRPELVATDPEYRNRGLVRAQFEVAHEWSAQRGEQAQGVTGIPWFYRQFGYEMAMTLGGGRVGYKPEVPELKDGEEEPYRLRPATVEDLPFIAEVYRHGCRRGPVACVRDEAQWRYEVDGRSKDSIQSLELRLIETPGGEPAGFVGHSPYLWGNMLAAQVYELRPGLSWVAASPSVVRYLWRAGGEMARAAGKEDQYAAFGLWLGESHPAYQAIAGRLPRVREPYAWYLRLPDVARFLAHVAPVLEERLAASVAAGHSGELKISFYRSGVRLVFAAGRLQQAAAWQPTREDGGSAAFPDLTFLQLLFGYRSLDEIRGAFADCWRGNDDTQALLNALFPRQPSNVWPLS